MQIRLTLVASLSCLMHECSYFLYHIGCKTHTPQIFYSSVIELLMIISSTSMEKHPWKLYISYLMTKY